MPLFTKQELKVLKAASQKPESRYRKKAYAIYHCDKCLIGVYYKILKCLLCNSTDIKERLYETYYTPNASKGQEIKNEINQSR